MDNWLKRILKTDWWHLLVWGIYVALLGVLLPHTAWAFQQFEPMGNEAVAWAAAFVFEGAILVLTRYLAKHIEQTPRYAKRKVRRPELDLSWRRFRWRYLNAFSLGLVVTIAISSVANWSHAVEFGRGMAVYAKYSLDPLLFTVGFGGILSFVSLLFARVLSNVQETEQVEDEAETEAKTIARELRKQLKETEEALAMAEGAAKFMLKLQAGEKRDRVLAAAERWPELPQSSVAIIAGASASYASEVLKGDNGR